MGSFGERMQREREMRGITLEEIAESTKIGTRSLRALEAEDFDKLPGGIFNKGFVRAYAKYLGIDEEQAVTDFMAACGEHQQQLPASPPAPALPGEREAEASSLNLRAALVAVAILVLAVAGWRFHQPLQAAASHLVQKLRRTPSSAPAHAAAAPISAPVAVEAASPAPAGMTAPTAMAPAPNPTPAAVDPKTLAKSASPEIVAAPGEFVLQIRARQDSWVSITADDQVLMEGVLKGEKTVHARSKVVFRTGNAGALEVSFNGQPQPPLGGDNQVRTVVFTADGLQR